MWVPRANEARWRQLGRLFVRRGRSIGLCRLLGSRDLRSVVRDLPDVDCLDLAVTAGDLGGLHVLTFP